MSTWIVHMRIADYFYKKIESLSAEEFIKGSLAPDCGYGKKDSPGKFTPPPQVTHWSKTGKKYDCRYNDFFKRYLSCDQDQKAYSFYLGYYIHLCTDILWSGLVYLPLEKKYWREIRRDPLYYLNFKRDCNELDFLFVSRNRDFWVFDVLDRIEEVRDYLSYYEKGQLTKQIAYIREYYHKNGEHKGERVFSFITQEMMERFLDEAKRYISSNLKRRGVL